MKTQGHGDALSIVEADQPRSWTAVLVSTSPPPSRLVGLADPAIMATAPNRE